MPISQNAENAEYNGFTLYFRVDTILKILISPEIVIFMCSDIFSQSTTRVTPTGGGPAAALAGSTSQSMTPELTKLPPTNKAPPEPPTTESLAAAVKPKTHKPTTTKPEVPTSQQTTTSTPKLTTTPMPDKATTQKLTNPPQKPTKPKPLPPKTTKPKTLPPTSAKPKTQPPEPTSKLQTTHTDMSTVKVTPSTQKAAPTIHITEKPTKLVLPTSLKSSKITETSPEKPTKDPPGPGNFYF